ncbi:MAG: tetratricopeptide repeat protein [Candidatus Latescibacteria bacterium]|nr:tetratricopeptide repeat protein [Candidatus Latescibacterota bacterium]
MIPALLIWVLLSGLCPYVADAGVSLSRAHADSLYRVALRLRDEGERDGAIAALRQVVAEDPRRTLAYCHLGHLLFDQQVADAAETFFKRALDVDDRCAEAYYGLGRVYRRRPKERLKAIQHFRSALARDSRHVEAMYEMAMTQLELDDYDAKSSFEDLIRIDPEHSGAYV